MNDDMDLVRFETTHLLNHFILITNTLIFKSINNKNHQ